MNLTRRLLLAALGLALPGAAMTTAAEAATAHHHRHGAHHAHFASAHPPHHGKPHRTASAMHGHPRIHHA